MYKVIECERHLDAKKRLFCKEDSCWVSLCKYCADENHKSHKIVDKFLMHNEIKAECERRIHECSLLSNTLKNVLKEFDSFTQRLIKKQQNVAKEEKKLESNLVKTIQKTSFNIDRQKDQLIKKAQNAITTIENQRSEVEKEIGKITGQTEELIARGSDEEIKRYMGNAEIPLYLKETTYQDLKARIEKDVNNFEKVSILDDFIDTLRPSSPEKVPRIISPSRASSRDETVKSALVSPRSGDQSKKKIILEELNNKINDRTQFLQELNMKIDIKEKDLSRLEKSNAHLIMSNTEKVTMIEKHNKDLAKKLGNLMPEKRLPVSRRRASQLAQSIGSFSPAKQIKIPIVEKKPLEEVQKILEAELGKLNIQIKNHTVDGLLLQLIEVVDKCADKNVIIEKSHIKNSEETNIKQLKDKIALLELQVAKLSKELKSPRVT